MPWALLSLSFYCAAVGLNNPFVQILMFFISGKFLWIISVTISSHLFSISFSKNVSNSSPLFDLIPHLSLWTNLVSPHPNSWKGKVQAYLLHKDTSDWLVAYCQPQPWALSQVIRIQLPRSTSITKQNRDSYSTLCLVPSFHSPSPSPTFSLICLFSSSLMGMTIWFSSSLASPLFFLNFTICAYPNPTGTLFSFQVYALSPVILAIASDLAFWSWKGSICWCGMGPER